MNSYEIQDAIMLLHNVARTVEREYGFDGQLSNDIRKCANRLADLHAEIYMEKQNG